MTLAAQFPALVVILPLFGAALCVLLRHARISHAVAVAVAWACFGMSVSLVYTVLPGPLSYEMGGWAPPLGIEYRVDVANAFILVLVSGIASVVLPFQLGKGDLSLPKGGAYLFYAAFQLTLSGLLGIAITGDLFNVFVFLEISSLGSYAMIALGRDRRALMAAFSYLVMGTIGGTFVLLGIGLVYQMTGSLNMADIAERLPAVMDTRTVRVALAFLCVGTSVKLAVFPLHQWLPNAYTYAPSVVSAFLASTATKVSYYVLVRVVFTVFGTGFVFGVVHFERLLVPLSLLAMFVGSTAAIFQVDLKRLLAYSSIAQIGYMTLGLGIANVEGLTGGMAHLLNHAVTKGGMFLAVACIADQVGSSKIDDLAGLGRRMPFTMAAFVVGGLSLIGVPATAGFVSKWYLVLGAIERGWEPIGFAILLSSLLAVVYVWRVVEVAYFREAPADRTTTEASPLKLGPTWVLIGAAVVLGLWTPWSAGLAGFAARSLLGVP